MKEQAEHGDRAILKGLLESEEDLGLPSDATHDHLFAEIAKRRRPKKTLSGKKRKRSEKPESYLERRSDASVGTPVDFGTDRFFRVERRLRRRAPEIGGRNVYVTRHEPPQTTGDAPLGPPRKRFKLATVSHPPGSLPKNEESLDDHLLAALTKTGHSEAVTHRVETNWPFLEDTRRLSERTTREQCKDCRVNYPSKPGAHHGYGFPYSAPVDHIHDDALHTKVLANQGKIGGLDLTEKEKTEFHDAEDSATWSRQFHPSQNPALEKAIGALGSQDSEDEYSDDEEEIYLDPQLRQFLPDLKMLGKAPVHDIPTDKMMSSKEYQEQSKWIEEQRQKKIEKAKTGDQDDSSESEKEDDD